MVIKIGDIDVLHRFLEEGRIGCLYCLYYKPDIGCERIYKRTKGKMKIDIPDPLNKECESFQPIFRCEDCKYFREERMKEAFAARTTKYTCIKRALTDEDIILCLDYRPKEDKIAEWEALYKKAGFSFVIE